MKKDEGYPFSIMLLEEGKPKKLFKATAWDDGARATITIFVVRKGVKVKLVKTYTEAWNRKGPMACLQAVIKYWKPFDPAIHTVTIIHGHEFPTLPAPVKAKKPRMLQGDF